MFLVMLDYQLHQSRQRSFQIGPLEGRSRADVSIGRGFLGFKETNFNGILQRQWGHRIKWLT